MFGTAISLHVNFETDSCSLLVPSGSSDEGDLQKEPMTRDLTDKSNRNRNRI